MPRCWNGAIRCAPGCRDRRPGHRRVRVRQRLIASPEGSARMGPQRPGPRGPDQVPHRGRYRQRDLPAPAEAEAEARSAASRQAPRLTAARAIAATGDCAGSSPSSPAQLRKPAGTSGSRPIALQARAQTPASVMDRPAQARAAASIALISSSWEARQHARGPRRDPQILRDARSCHGTRLAPPGSPGNLPVARPLGA